MGILKGRDCKVILNGVELGSVKYHIEYDGVEFEPVISYKAGRLTLSATYTGLLFFRLYPIQNQFKNPICIMLDVVLGG